MPLNLKKFQSITRRRIDLKWQVDFKNVSKSAGRTNILSVSSNSSSQIHTILYSNVEGMHPADIYHEFCKAKLNEIGFTTIEAAALSAIRDCCKEDPKYIRDANSAVAIVSETYSNELLFSKFQEESKSRRESIVNRFESNDALTTLHTQMDFWGTAGVCYYKLASERTETFFPQKQIEQAIERTTNSEIQKEYDQINKVLQELPKLDFVTISDTDSIRIVEIITSLFSLKTGLEC